MQILTHRGLEPENVSFFTESTIEAFSDQLARGFGIEFDIIISKDDKLITFHDDNLKRFVPQVGQKRLSEMTSKEIRDINLPKGHFCDLEELLALILRSTSPLNALHLKSKFQNEKHLNILISSLETQPQTLSRLVIFDLIPETAIYLKQRLPTICLAPSVAHKYDIFRYNAAVGGTLMSVDDVLQFDQLFNWVWLDEWDRSDIDGGTKELYTFNTIERLRDKQLKIAIVSPELHGSSPGLLKNESHQDARDFAKLRKRIDNILLLKPDAICTDYPNLLKQLITKI